MSGLPKYSPADLEAGEHAPLVKASRDSFDDLPVYPPRQEIGSSGGQINNVTYTFVPVYPVEGKTQQVMGILGRSKEETIEIVQRAFPTLATYPAHRMQFEVAVENRSRDEPEWSQLMDEAWAQFGRQPPSRLKVSVIDGPGDAQKRKRRERLHLFMVLGLSAALPMALLVFCATAIFSDMADDSS